MEEIYLPAPAPPEDLAPLYQALSAAQAEITAAELTRENPHLRTKYATLAAVWDACRTPLTKHGLCVLQLPAFDGARVHVETILAHKSGAKIQAGLTLAPAKLDAQGIGSAITYARRYTLASLVGVCPDDDDDGAQASQPARQAQQAQQQPVTPPPPPAKSSKARKAEPTSRPAQASTASLPENPHKAACETFYQAAKGSDGVLGEDGKIDADATRQAVVSRLTEVAPSLGLDAPGNESKALQEWLSQITAAQVTALTEAYLASAEADKQARPALEPSASEAVVEGLLDGLPV